MALLAMLMSVRGGVVMVVVVRLLHRIASCRSGSVDYAPVAFAGKPPSTALPARADGRSLAGVAFTQ